MSDSRPTCPAQGAEREDGGITRREAVGGLVALAAAFLNGGCAPAALEELVQTHFHELDEESRAALLKRLEEKYTEKYGRPFSVSATPAEDGVQFGYALDISRCVGCRRCVYACVEENNQSRDPAIQWISVLEMDKEKGIDVFESDLYYDPETVPQPEKFYFPVGCQQCRNPPCVKVCPVNATWKDGDGIVVIDYDWCIGCRCCMTACPYGARHFNWREPSLPGKDDPDDRINTETEYLGNRPRPRGVVEKCTFCVQRTRRGLYPACVEACPVGARKFGNLLDPESEIRYVLENKRVFIFKEELGTEPRFYYYFGT